MLTESELEFVQECFDTIEDINQRERTFLYRQGFQDCIRLLKDIGILC